MSKATIRQWVWTATTAVAFGSTGWLLGHSGWGAPVAAEVADRMEGTPAPRESPAAAPALAVNSNEAAPMDADRGLAASEVDDAARLMPGNPADRFDTVLQAQKTGTDAVPQVGTVTR